MKEIPKHIAIIMDGNGRWAEKRKMDRIFGHRNAINAVKESIEGAMDFGVKYLTLYAFSIENWNRPRLEIEFLMQLLIDSLKKELSYFQEKNVKLNSIGKLSLLPEKSRQCLNQIIDLTKTNNKITLTLSLSYSSREEIIHCFKQIAEKIKKKKLKIDEIDESIIEQNLYTHNLPDVDLMIRTSGEKRLSNYLLWQLAYTELFFTKTLWPDFKKEDLYKAVYSYKKRERRFGKTSEQLQKKHEPH